MGKTQSKGQEGEDIAEKYYLSKKYKIVAKNFRCKRGEIDLIFQKDRVLLFVEVKNRSRRNSLDQFEWVSRIKRARIHRAIRIFESTELAQQYLAFDRRIDFLLVSEGRVAERFSE